MKVFILFLAFSIGLSCVAMGQRPAAERTNSGLKSASETKPQESRSIFDANGGYASKLGGDTTNTAMAFGVTFGRRLISRRKFTFESLGNLDVLKFSKSSTESELVRTLGGSTLVCPQFGFRVTNGQVNGGKRVALGLKFSGGIASDVQQYLQLNFKGKSPNLSLSAAPSIAFVVGNGRYLGCQLDISYLGRSASFLDNLQNGLFITPRFSFQF